MISRCLSLLFLLILVQFVLLYHLPCNGGTEHSVDGKCYLYIDVSEVPWTHETTCQAWDSTNLLDRVAHLASIESWAQETYLFTNMVDVDGDAWLGLRLDSFQYFWLDGAPITYLQSRAGALTTKDGKGWHFFAGAGSPYEWKADDNNQRAICSYDIPICFTVPGDDSAACSSNGFCLGTDTCVCTVAGMTGPDCSDFFCYSIPGNDTTNVCSGHGECIGTDTCDCEEGYDTLANCSMRWCEFTGCSGNGICQDNSTGGVSCVCDEGFGGSLCSVPVTCSPPCGSHGTCAGSDDVCRCDSGWGELDCETPSCDIVSNCSGNGDCIIGPNICTCDGGFFGTECENAFAVCGPGEYVDIATFTVCLVCIEGYYCPDGLYPVACPIGTYCNGTSLRSNFTICSPGRYCPDGINQIDCGSNGVYCPSTSLSTPLVCPAGKYCEGPTSIIPQNCSEGFYCPEGSISLKGQIDGDLTERICSEGCYCGSNSDAPTCPCDEGYYCPLGSINATAELCPDSFFCSSGLAFSCPNGTVGSGLAVRSECTPIAGISCSIGEYIDSDSICQNCPTGSYCTDAQRHDCPLGTYCNDTSLTNYTICPTGSICDGWSQTSCGTDGVYCPQIRMSFPLMCPSGSYCPGPSTVSPLSCEGGYYCEMGSIGPRGQKDGDASELVCPEGCYCSEGSSGPSCPCDDGYYCPKGVSLNATAYGCPAGHYCLSGQKIECPNGTFAPTFAPRTHCLACPAGVCPNETAACIVGEYLDVDGISCLDCSSGFYCPNDGLSHACPSGSVCNGTNRGSPTLCSAGHICNDGITEADCGTSGVYCPISGLSVAWACPSGDYCSGPNTIVPLPCDAGFYCPEGSVGSRGQTDGDPTEKNCPSGCYCPSGVGSPMCPCDDGYYCDVGSTTATNAPCPAGYFCKVGVLFPCANGTYGDGATVRHSCLDCPVGKVCAVDSTPTDCPIGTYCPAKTLTVSGAVACPSGCYCGTNAASPTCPCNEGYYCAERSTNATSELCPPGHYCSLGQKLACPNGTYALGSEARPVCADCPAGFECPDPTQSPVPCGAGTYCPPSTAIANSCPEGCYCGAGSGAPTCPCDVGYYCPSSSTSATEQLCPAGKSCVEGLATPCPTGTTALVAASRSVCSLCPAGSYCSSPLSVLTCPNGYFCPQGTDSLGPGLLCPAGYACPAGTTASTAGGLCDDGYCCPTGSSSHTEDPCPAGSFCVNGLPRICPNGTFALTNAVRTTCDRCPSQQFCYGGSNYTCIGLVGWVCDPGSDRPLPCPEHYRCIDGAKELIEREQLEAEKEAAEEEAEEQKQQSRL